jgi:hypothetical protein
VIAMLAVVVAIALTVQDHREPIGFLGDRDALEEAFTQIRAKKYLIAVARLAPLVKSKSLPPPVLEALPALIDELRALDAVSRLSATPSKEKFPAVSAELLPKPVQRPYAWLELLGAVRVLVESRVPDGTKLPWGAEQAEMLLTSVAADFDAQSASRLRLELSAKLFLLGRPRDATKLLEGEASSEYARQVLEDLRTIVVGGGTLTNPQIARFVPEKGLSEMPGAEALVPAALRANWPRPRPPAVADTTLEKLEERTRGEVARSARAELDRLAKSVDAATEKVRARLEKP